MKTQVAPYQTAVKCLRIECTNGSIFRITSYPKDLTMSNGQIYVSGSGYEFTGYTATSTTTPAAIDLAGIFGFAGISRAMVASGVFDNARCYLFNCNYLNPVEDYEPITASILGKATMMDDKYVIEEMSLIDALNQSVGKTYTATCPKKLGGSEYAGCALNLNGTGPSGYAYTVTGSITAVTSNQVFTDSNRSEPTDWFSMGTIIFTSGYNYGLRLKEVKTFTAGGLIEVFEPFYYTPQVGDTYTMVVGCRKRLADCRDKFNNVVNFGGFSYIPTSSQYSQVGTK